MRSRYIEVMQAYLGSNGDVTKALYAELEAIGPAGAIAVNLFRAHKTSNRAKKYRGGSGGQSFRSMAYDTKRWAMENLCTILMQHGAKFGLVWGWGFDDRVQGFENVLFVELPEGQVSFHSNIRFAGPDYPKKWDEVRNVGAHRIARFCADVLDRKVLPKPTQAVVDAPPSSAG